MFHVLTCYYGHFTTKFKRKHAKNAREQAIRLLQECVRRRGDTAAIRVVKW